MSSTIHPTGTFNDVEIRDHGFDESGANKTPHLWVIFKTSEGKLTGRFYLTEKSAEYTLEKIKTMGFTGDNLGDLADGEALLGKACQITVEHDEYEGKTNAKVAFVNENNSTGGMKRDDAAAANVTKFNQLWKKTRGKSEKDADLPF